MRNLLKGAFLSFLGMGGEKSLTGVALFFLGTKSHALLTFPITPFISLIKDSHLKCLKNNYTGLLFHVRSVVSVSASCCNESHINVTPLVRWALCMEEGHSRVADYGLPAGDGIQGQTTTDSWGKRFPRSSEAKAQKQELVIYASMLA